MSIQNWSDDITVVELNDDPQFTDDVAALIDSLNTKPTDAVLNFAAVDFINSSNIALLLRLRKLITGVNRRLIFCDVNTQVWGVFMVTGLDKIFEATNDISVALTTLQLTAGPGDEKGK